MPSHVGTAWRDAWAHPRLRPHVLVAPIAVALVLDVLTRFLTWNEARPGARLTDPLLPQLAAHDVSGLVFAIVYGSVAAAAIETALRHPRWLIIGCESYCLMILIRIAAMYLTPLDPPAGMIVLRDPLVQQATMAPSLTRDLFFSGHTATVFLTFLVARGPWLKAVLLLGAVVVGAGVLVQHVHYTVDVLVAPLAASASFAAVTWAHRRG
jgi:hypothetical protein